MTNTQLTRRALLRSGVASCFCAACSRLRAAPPRDVAWLSEIQQPPKSLPADAPMLSDVLVDAGGRRITSIEVWNKKRSEIGQWWLDFLGPMPANRKAAPQLTLVEEDRAA